ncbi:MAG: argininosuccinate lyase [Clostridiales Family XIII bacterium]|jgi:argininosuccinate lyase|nr:argininosuccinate lyase [Clostridiales Family XIII bacterium]
MKDKLWGGRFKEKPSEFVDEWAASIDFDRRLYKEDIALNIAHSKMLAEKKIISKKDFSEIKNGLIEIEKKIDEGKFKFSYEKEDIHMNIEAALIKKIGKVGMKLNTAKSRNDQVATDLRLYTKKEIIRILALLTKLNNTLLLIATKHNKMILPGYTHLQHAQPVTLSMHIKAYIEMFKRDSDRLENVNKRVDIMPLGSGALSGVPYSIDRKFTQKELGFKTITKNPMDAVSDRDFIIEFISTVSIIMMHLSRFSEEYILWASQEFAFLTAADSYSTGSSIMPNKKNPDIAELIRGKTGRIYGNLMQVLTIMKGLPLTYNKDMQEMTLPLFDTIDTLSSSLIVFEDMLKKTKFNKEEMLEKTEKGFMNATAVADYLVVKNIPFREAHRISGGIVAYAINENKSLKELKLEDYKKFSNKFQDDIFTAIDYKVTVKKNNDV